MPATKRKGSNPGSSKLSASAATAPALTRYTREEVAKHSTPSDLWLIIDGSVFDITAFLERHPGGPAPLRYAGQDASEVFHRIHNKATLKQFGGKFLVGTLAAGPACGDDSSSDEGDNAGPSDGYDVAVDVDGYDLRKGGEDGREFGDHMAPEGQASHLSQVSTFPRGTCFTSQV